MRSPAAVIIASIWHGIGTWVLLLSAGQAGATAPAPLATAVVQAVAEVLVFVYRLNGTIET